MMKIIMPTFAAVSTVANDNVILDVNKEVWQWKIIGTLILLFHFAEEKPNNIIIFRIY